MTALATIPPVIADPLLRRLYQYWDRERGSRPMPTRDSVDPIKMRYVLGHLALIDVLPDAKSFRIRLHGTELVACLGADFTGKRMDEVPLNDLRKLAVAWFTCVTERHVPHHEHVDRVIDGLTRHFEVLVLPYSRQHAGVDLMLVAVRCRAPTLTALAGDASG